MKKNGECVRRITLYDNIKYICYCYVSILLFSYVQSIQYIFIFVLKKQTYQLINRV